MVDSQSNHPRSKPRNFTRFVTSIGAIALVVVSLWLLLGDNSPAEIEDPRILASAKVEPESSTDRRSAPNQSMATIASRSADKAVYGARNDLSSRISVSHWQNQGPPETSKPKEFKSPKEELEYLESRLEGERQLLAFRKRATEHMGRKIQKSRNFDERPNLLEQQTIVEKRLEEQKEAVDNLEKRIADLRSRVR